MLYPTISFGATIRTISFTKHEKFLLVGLQDGSLHIISCSKNDNDKKTESN